MILMHSRVLEGRRPICLRAILSYICCKSRIRSHFQIESTEVGTKYSYTHLAHGDFQSLALVEYCGDYISQCGKSIPAVVPRRLLMSTTLHRSTPITYIKTRYNLEPDNCNSHQILSYQATFTRLSILITPRIHQHVCRRPQPQIL